MNDSDRIAINTGGGDAPGRNVIFHATIHAAPTTLENPRHPRRILRFRQRGVVSDRVH
jgi:hypothetical protein